MLTSSLTRLNTRNAAGVLTTFAPSAGAAPAKKVRESLSQFTRTSRMGSRTVGVRGHTNRVFNRANKSLAHRPFLGKRQRTNRTGATGSVFRIKRGPAMLLGSAVARSTVMFLTRSRRILAAGSLLLFVAVVAYPQKRRLTQSEAVALAEQFIAQNGYTDLPPDKTKLSYETIEWDSNVDLMLQRRHNTLERRAYGVLRRRADPGWTVAFRYEGDAGATGRAVTMNLDGTKARVQHQDFILRYAKKL